MSPPTASGQAVLPLGLSTMLSTESSRVAAPSNFEITRLMPALRASFIRCSVACMVNRTIAVLGAIEEIFRAASRPFMTGIDKSRITISGFSALTRSTATAPFSASPQTSQPSRRSNHARRERRMGGLSSTIRTVVDIRMAPSHTLSWFPGRPSSRRSIGTDYDRYASSFGKLVRSIRYTMYDGDHINVRYRPQTH